MPLCEMYVVLVREKGLFLVEPVPGQTQSAVIETALGLKGGYSTGLATFDLSAEATDAWVAWVEGQTPDGTPYFEYRALNASLTEAEVTARLQAMGETPLKLHRSAIYRGA